MAIEDATHSGATERLLRRDWAVLLFTLAALFALAGVYTIFGVGMNMSALEMTVMSGMRNMPSARLPGQWSSGYAVLVFLMWWVMMVAMMLPSVSPVILLYSVLLRRGAAAKHVPFLSAVFLTGYLMAWAGFAAVATVTQWRLEATEWVSASMMTLIGGAPGALILIAAGVFQFSPLKAACLRHCRSPAAFLTQRKRNGAAGAFAMGLEHGIYCLGCCWLLMVLLFVGGIMNLYWIVGLTAFVALEKLAPFGKALSKLVGAGLILWGADLLLNAL